MEQQAPADELLANWSLAPEDLALLDGLGGPGRLGLAVQLAFWRQHSRFPDDDTDVLPAVIAHLASQVGIVSEALDEYDWVGRTGRRHRRMILDHLAIATFGDTAEALFRRWLADEVLPHEPRPAVLEDEITTWFAGNRIVRPGTYRLADKGYDLRLIQDYLGHRDPRHTVHYTRVAGRRFEGLWR
jgi:integrase